MMKNRNLYLTLLLIVAMALAGCTGFRKSTDVSAEAEDVEVRDLEYEAEEEREPATLAETERLGEEGMPTASLYEERLLDEETSLWPDLPEIDSELMRLAEEEGRLLTIYFGYDSHALNDSEKKAIKMNARWLLENKHTRIKVEGHADERGTEEYNLALGERRAISVFKFLADLGVEDERLATITYGEEKPVVEGKDEESWALNRRVEFILLGR